MRMQQQLYMYYYSMYGYPNPMFNPAAYVNYPQFGAPQPNKTGSNPQNLPNKVNPSSSSNTTNPLNCSMPTMSMIGGMNPMASMNPMNPMNKMKMKTAIEIPIHLKMMNKTKKKMV